MPYNKQLYCRHVLGILDESETVVVGRERSKQPCFYGELQREQSTFVHVTSYRYHARLHISPFPCLFHVFGVISMKTLDITISLRKHAYVIYCNISRL